MFELVYPVHCVQLGKAGVVFRVLDVGQSVESQELRSPAQLSPFGVEVLFKIILLFFEVFLGFGLVLVLVVRVVNENDEVDPEVELQLLDCEVFRQLFLRRLCQHLPSFKEVIFVA